MGRKPLLTCLFASFIVGCFSQVTNGLVAYYPFDGNANDSSGNNNNGTIVGGVTLTADRFGNPNSAYHFDGSSGYILCRNDSQLIGSKNVSYSAWFRVQNRSSGYQQNVMLANIGAYEASGGFEAFTSNPPGTYASMFRNATHFDQQLNGMDSIQPNVWYQLLVVMRYDSLIDSTTVINYIDCAFDDSARFAGGINYDAISQLYIGANLDIACCQRYFLGDIDDVRIYDIALNPCGTTYINTTANIACGDSFTFGGIAYYLPITKTDTINSINGDTIITLTLNVTDTVTIFHGLCAGDSISFYGTWIHTPGQYDTVIVVPNACDSMIMLSIAVQDPLPPTHLYDTICNDDSVLFNGTYLDTAGIYYAHYTPQTGCDSMVILNLSINPVAFDSIFADRTSICNGDTAHLCSADSFISYNWNSGAATNCIAVTQEGSYRLSVTDNNNCKAVSNTISIATFSAPSALVQPDSALICSNDSIQLCATPGFSYQWNTGEQTACIYVSGAGDYYVTVTDANQCTAESNHASLGIFPVSSVSVVVYGDTFESYNGMAYQWYLDGQMINGASNNIFIASGNGSYSVQITDSNGCIAVSSIITYTGVENITGGLYPLILYPNPAHDNLTVEYNGLTANSQIEIIDVLGRTVKTEHVNSPAANTQVDIHTLSNGLYFLRIVNDVGVVSGGKFTVVR